MWPGARIHPAESAIQQAAAAAKKAAKEAAKAAAAMTSENKPPAKASRKPLSKYSFEPGSAQWAASRYVCPILGMGQLKIN